MGRVTSLTLDQCPITPSSVKFVLEKCPELTNVVVSTEHGLVDRPEVFDRLEPLTAQTSTQFPVDPSFLEMATTFFSFPTKWGNGSPSCFRDG